MRWDNLRLSEAGDAVPPLPLGLPEATVRTFDTPEFRGITFYEVLAKSIVNKVPASSRMTFQWTVNPYRGCSHACVYCLSGDTRILLASGRTRPLSELRVGDSVVGTVLRGNYRRFVTTEVRAHWATVKRAYRIRLADSTVLIASADHRFLTERGWKYVAGSMTGAPRRPHLTVDDRLVGIGRFADPPKDTPEYQRGYLSGLIRGYGDVHRFRPTLAGTEALDRARTYLAELGITISRLIEWPADPGLEWQKGFLAGIFDAGDTGSGPLRSADTDPVTISHVAAAMGSLGFTSAIEETSRPGLRYVRLLGGTPELVRFLHTTDPAITRKCLLDGRAVRNDAPPHVVSVEDLGFDLPLYDITTGTGDFVADGVVSHNCFARNTHTYLDLDAGHDFDSRVVVKVNAPDLLRRELAAPRWAGEHIAMGTNVDCYQRAEGRYRLMPPIIEALRDAANPFSILTKGTLILRDLDLLRQAAEVTTVGVAMSVGFVDEELWRSVEPGTPSPRRRLDAVRALTDAGFSCGVLMAPVLPGLTDTPEQIDRTVAAIAAAGAASVTPLPLHLRPGAREWYLGWLGRTRPDLVEHYQELYRRGAYAPGDYQRQVTARVRMAARRYGISRGPASQARRLAADAAPARAGPATSGQAPHGADPVADAGTQLRLL